MKSFLKRMVLGVLLTLLSLVLRAQNAPESAVSLTIRFAGGISEFHVGEKIPVELSFTSSAPETFELSPRNYDRSGRLDLDEFNVTPAARDPLQNYFENMGGRMGGGLSSMPEYLSNEPKKLTEELNEWVAIDEPGHYSLSVKSRRVGRGGQPFGNPITIESNTLEFDVVDADTAWQQQTLVSALAILDDPNSKPEEKEAALRTLRFLDSPASIRELARLITEPGQEHSWECNFGLIGSRHQKLVVRELEMRMAAPEAAITSGFLYLLTQTKFMLNHDPVPQWPENEAGQKAYTEHVNARQQELETLQTSLYLKAASLLSVKTGAARAATVQTLLTASPAGDGKTKPSARLSDSDIEAALLGLPQDAQYNLLKDFWPQVRRPMMAGVLEQILDKLGTHNPGLHELALVRLNELDHEKAVARVLEEIQHPRLGIRISSTNHALNILPDKLMPQIDTMLAARLEKKDSPTLDFDSQLTARYATRAILPRVKAVYASFKGDADCQVKDGLVSYFLRVDTDFGVRQLKDSNFYCMKQSLETAARMRQWSALEPTVIAQLNDPNAYKARAAAEMLAQFGGAEAKKAMFERLRKFHEEWVKREAEFRSTPGTPKEINDASSLQYGLLMALETAQGWILNDAELEEMEQLAIGPAKENVSSRHPPGSEKATIAINLIDLDDFTVSIDRYTVHNLNALRAKLAQFPSGTRFVFFDVQSDKDKRSEPVIEAIHDVVQRHGFNLETARNQ